MHKIKIESKSSILSTPLRIWYWIFELHKMGREWFNRMYIVALLCLSTCMTALLALAEAPDQLHTEAGQVVLKQLERDGVTIGEYYQYLPCSGSCANPIADYQIPMPIGSNPLTVVVLVHGTIRDDADARAAAQDYLSRYKTDANTQWFAVIAPVFSQTDYGGNSGPLGGYRGMVGRHKTGVDARKTDADGFVNGILDAYQHKHPEIFTRRALFYGHSAGGQFLSRYLVTHPDRVAAMVISSSGTYPFPDRSIKWTNGMDSLETCISWDSASNCDPLTDRSYKYFPSGSMFKSAARLPVTIMVGDSEDCTIIPNASSTPGYDDGSNGIGPCCPDGPMPLIWNSGTSFTVSIGPCRKKPEWSPIGAGTNHLRGHLWQQAMRSFADLSPSDPGIDWKSPHVQHSSAQTQPEALPILMVNKPTEFSIDWLGSTMAPVLFY